MGSLARLLAVTLVALGLFSQGAAASEATLLTAKFAAMTGPGWTGADAAWSARLPDGRTAWLFGDTFLGGVDAAGDRDPAAPMVRNSMVVEERDATMRTLIGGTVATPGSLVGVHGADDWYWPGPPVVGKRVLQVAMAHIVRTGPGGWDFRATGTAIAEFALPSLQLRAVTPVGTPPGVNMASAAVTTGGFTYIYGTRDGCHGSKLAYVARVRAGDLRRKWSYWTGRAWSADPAAAAPIAHGVSDQFSVVRDGSRWALVTQVPLSNAIVAFSAHAPEGPWTRIGQIAQIPAIPHGMTYNAIVHAEYSHGRTLLVGYSVNATEPGFVFRTAALYRPRFMTVRLPRLDSRARARRESRPTRQT